MAAPFFDDLKKHASFYLKETTRAARLVLTDVTPVQLMVEEATSGSTRPPDAKTMRFISRSAFEPDAFYRIIEILHKRLSKFERKNWREAYNSLVLLEYLLTHGPMSFAIEFQVDSEIIQEMRTLQYIDEKGFNWGLTLKNKSERVLKLLERGTFLKEEREKVGKLVHKIKGFGSSNGKLPSTSNNNEKTNHEPNLFFRRSNSQYETYSKDEMRELISSNSLAERQAQLDFEEAFDHDHPFYFGL